MGKGSVILLVIFENMKWKLVAFLMLSGIGYSYAQNREEVKAYYTAHNQILENFARSQDTSMYLDEMSAFIKMNGKSYVRLTYDDNFLDFCIKRNRYELAYLVVETRLKHSINAHFYLKDTAVRNSSDKKNFYSRPEILLLINNSESEYKELMANVDLFKSMQLTSLHELDQFGRTIALIESVDSATTFRSEIMKYTDSANLVRMYDYIEQYGFPKEDEVGYFIDFMIMWHTYCRPCEQIYTLPNGQWYYDYLDSVYYEAVLDGLVRNTYYAYLKDRSINQQWVESFKNCFWKGQKYVTRSAGLISHPLYDAKNIDKHRAEIYLPPYWVDAVLNGWEIPEDYPIPDNVKLKY